MSTPDPTADQRPSSYTGRIIIRLEQGGRSDAQDLSAVTRESGYANLAKFLADHPTIKAERVIRYASPKEIRAREAAAARSAFPPRKSLTSYWRLDVRSEPEPEKLRATLQAMPEIEIAYHETPVIEAAPPVSGNPYETFQCYLDPAPQGIDARWAWTRANGKGEGVSVVDLEYGWLKYHEDVPAFTVLDGDNGALHGATTGDHGTAVLAVIGGSDNTVGVIGIAPNLAHLDVVSHYCAETDSNLHVANALYAATTFLQPGDIVCIEVQRPQGGKSYPVEIDSADLEAINLACAEGIIVVEAAGNSQNNDLDEWPDPTGERSLDPSSAKFVDSGAIMVGASQSAVVTDPLGFAGHERYDGSNYGKRIDCYAPGQGIYTAGFGPLGGPPGTAHCYTSSFGGTSGATAIIAGAAAVVQSWHKGGWLGQALTPLEMRQVLSAVATGTKQANSNGDPIGVMPNLAAIMTWRAKCGRMLRRMLGWKRIPGIRARASACTVSAPTAAIRRRRRHDVHS